MRCCILYRRSAHCWIRYERARVVVMRSKQIWRIWLRAPDFPKTNRRGSLCWNVRRRISLLCVDSIQLETILSRRFDLLNSSDEAISSGQSTRGES